MTKINVKRKIIGSILLFLFIFSSSSLLFSTQAKNLSSNGKSVENLEKLKLSTTYWTTTEVVSTENAHDPEHPTIAVDSTGSAHIAWADYNETGSYINYKRWDATSSRWTTTEVASNVSTLNTGYPAIAVDSTGNVHLVWEEHMDYGGPEVDINIFYKRWNATNNTWTTTEMVSTESTLDYSQRPTIAVDGDGNAHVAWRDWGTYGGAGGDTDIFYKRWNATSDTWTITEVVSTESTGGSFNPAIAVDDAGNTHVAWNDQTDYNGAGKWDEDIFYKRWNATSSTWTTTEIVSAGSTLNSYNPTIATDSVGNVHVAWEEFSDNDIFYRRWNATSSTWTMIEVVSTGNGWNVLHPMIVEITMDDIGNVHLVWEEYTDYSGSGVDTDIFYRRWNINSSKWTTIEVVSTESISDSHSPTIAVDSKGKVHVAWEDGSGVDIDICYKRLEELSGKSSELFDMVIIIITASIIGGIGLAIVITIILIRKRK